MSTNSIVPRADGEGSIGTKSKTWGAVYAKNINGLRDITPEIYGAKGDGSTLDTDALNTALYHAEGGILRLLSGKTYLINRALNVTNNTTIIGNGAKIIGSGTSYFAFNIDNKKNIVIDGVEFENVRRAVNVVNSNNISLKNLYAHDMYRDTSVFEDNYMIVLNNSRYVTVDGVTYFNQNLNGDCIRIKGTCIYIACKNIRGYCGDTFFALVTDEDVTANSQNYISIENVALTAENYCGIQIEMRRADSSIKNLVIKNCQLYGSEAGEAIRFANSTSGYYDENNEIGVLENVCFDSCKFILDNDSDGSRPLVRLHGVNIRTMYMHDCVFTSSFARSTVGNIIDVKHCTLQNSIFENLIYNADAAALNTMFNFDENNTLSDIIIKGCIYSGRAVNSTTANFVECLSNANISIDNCRIKNGKYLINAGVVSGTLLLTNNIGQNYTYNSSGANTVSILGGGNVTTSNNDIYASSIYRLSGDFRTNKTPTNPTKADHYIYSDSASVKYKYYNGTSWTSL